MRAGTALDDADRRPWLQTLARVVAQHLSEGSSAVLACSALKRSYRDAILAEAPDARFIHLTGSHELLDERMQRRTDHFMPPSLLESQLATLEPLAADEPGVAVENVGPVDAVVATIIDALGSKA